VSRTEFQRTVNKHWPARGEWTRVTLDGKFTARIKCPDCCYIGLLDHEISMGGNVTPSVQCPGFGGKCSYHESGVVLVGWLA
jgi:hypothetical protein